MKYQILFHVNQESCLCTTFPLQNNYQIVSNCSLQKTKEGHYNSKLRFADWDLAQEPSANVNGSTSKKSISVQFSHQRIEA